MESLIKKSLKLIKEIDKDKKILFISIYGSYLTDKYNENLSDIDIAIYYLGDKKEKFKFRREILGKINSKFDIHIFQDLPLYIKNDIVKTGKVLYKKDFSSVCDIYISVIREFNLFEKYLNRYYSILRGENLA